MNVQNIKIALIKRLENIRVRIEEKDVHTLIASIKQDGLLQPIGIAPSPGKKEEYYILYGNRRLEACKKLGWETIPAVVHPKQDLKDQYIKNTLENLEREDLNESEIGRIFDMFKEEYKMTDSEIASRFGFTLPRVERALKIYNYIPEEHKKDVKFLGGGGYKRGKIPATAANAILGMRRKYNLNKKQISELLEQSKQDGFSNRHLDIVGSLLQVGYSIDEAVASAKEYTVVSLKIPIKQQTVKDMKKKYNKSFARIVVGILNGTIKTKMDIPTWKSWN